MPDSGETLARGARKTKLGSGIGEIGGEFGLWRLHHCGSDGEECRLRV